MRRNRPNPLKREPRIGEQSNRQSPQPTYGGKRKNKGAKWPFSTKLRLALIVTLFVGLLLASQFQRLPIAVPVYYAVMSLITFLCYALDKRAAQRDNWRISENRLHMLSLIGGWPGAMLGQQHLRHKSSKRAFRVVLWLTVIINISLLGALVSPQGQALLTQLGVN
ncbi:DUF1294 domain-containing protein [Shewanella aegiceratis]|uniref:DUF1294 domain-containing protein n=1 Tax=Shewanella aegiceratis TaxID=2864203 RepID=UPI001C654FE1|nr:DUF1294 domain-containing protein [Shewanella aegiceratis]QYJ83357.1 DUF1294 domain-containing protein [Shewanella aegiceratis]